ncbi:hypothetical protein D3C78_1799610 [compost metagenome]
MAACTSCSATPSETSSENCKVITEMPLPLVEDICFKPGICPKRRSSGAVTARAVTVGLAPGYCVVTWMMG